MHISTLRAKLRRPDEDLHQLRCEISRLVELAYPDDPLVILDRTARDFFIGALTPLTLREKVLDLGPNTLDEALAAAQRYESNQQVLKGVLTFLLQRPKRRWTGILLHIMAPPSPQHGLSSSFNNKQEF